MIDIGKYKAKATGGDFGKSREKGTRFVLVPFTITQGPSAGESVAWTGYFTDNTSARTMDSLRFCGCTFPGDDIFNLTGIDSNEVEIVVEHQTYEKDGEQKTAARVAWVNSLIGTVRDDQRMDDAERASFRQKMAGAVMRSKTRTPAGPTTPKTNGNGARSPAQAEEVPPPNDADVPF